MTDIFQCKQFDVAQKINIMKVNTDAIMLGAWTTVDSSNYILDIGTGTGIIALMLAQKSLNTSLIHGVEIDEDSAREAAMNFRASRWKDRMRLFSTSIQELAKESDLKYDLIVSNPPFFSGGTFTDSDNKWGIKHTTRLSHGDLLVSVNRLLHASGKFCVILPYLEGERFIDLASRSGMYPSRITKMFPYEGRPIERLLIELGRELISPIEEEFNMYNSDANNDYSQDYLDLTLPFLRIGN